MEFLLAGLAVLAAICFARPRLGMLVVVAAGFTQDPLRKLTSGSPVAFVLIALVLYAAVVAGMAATGAFRPVGSSSTVRRLGAPLAFFMAFVALQALHLFLRTGNAVLPAIGFVSYVAPVVAGSVGFVMGMRKQHLVRFLKVYSWWGLAAAATVLVSRFIPGAAIFRSVGVGLMVYGEDLGVRLSSGILRTPEVAAWHAATTGCVLLILLSLEPLGKRSRKSLLLGAAAITVIVLAVLWTGRRKALVELFLFLLIFAVLLFRLRGGTRRLLGAVALGGTFLGYQLVEGIWSAGSSREAAYLLQRGGTTTGEGGGRFLGALSSVPSALETYGIFGVGAGAAAQGSQYFGGEGSVSWVAESGLGRITAELGLFGLVILGWLVVRFGSVLRRGLRVVSRRDVETAKLALGLLSLLVANAAVFVTAAQIFGDPFVYLLLGTMAGGLAGMSETEWVAAFRTSTVPISPLRASQQASS